MEWLSSILKMLGGIGVTLILILLLTVILLLLFLRFHLTWKKVNLPISSFRNEETPGPTEWEQKMLLLAENHSDVKPARFNFVLDDYNQAAYRQLNKIRNNISQISTEVITLIPAARWLFDNFQMMYREIKKIRTSGTSYEVLPILKETEYRGFPRIYIVAKMMVSLSGGHINEENIAVMLKAYQSKVPLTDKELWVLPEILGFCLLESIIEVAKDILQLIKVKAKADQFVRNRLRTEKELIEISDLLVKVKHEEALNYSFHSQVIYQLRKMSFDEGTIQKYIDYHLNSQGKSIRQTNIFHEESKIESRHETYIRALIMSLREINEVDTESFFAEYSYLEHILALDPAKIYPKMDPDSRGMYRGVIVDLSLTLKKKEEDIAKLCLELATVGHENLNCANHVGTYLIGKGYRSLKEKIKNREKKVDIKKRRNGKGFLYFLSLSFIFVVVIGLIGFLLSMLGGVQETGVFILLLFPALCFLLGIAMEITNFIFTRQIKVTKIPSLDYMKEIPDQARTFVVMPVIISSKEQGMEYLNRLQKHYLANQQSNLYFALLVDYSDFTMEHRTEDQEIDSTLTKRVKELNEHYPSNHQRFSIFIRYRKWNPSENVFMGWERKRGKLEEFNYLLSGAKKEDTSFSITDCEQEILTSFRYVITLDADSDLIRDNAAKLVGLIDHPLNHAVVDLEHKKVMEGYVIIQPTVRNHIIDSKGSHFSEIFSGQSGLTHYSTVISDIYQDIFHKAIFCGKGIYNVQAFHQLLHGVIPENSVLSHDLLESCYATAAFSSHVTLMDTFPLSVISYAKREHRWIRGDWQLIPWLFAKKAENRKTLCKLSRWKIFDNLRRSLLPVSKTLFVLLNLALAPQAWYLWIPFIFFSDIFNLVIFLFAITTQKILRPKLVLVYRGFFREIGVMIQRALIEFALTPYRAYVSCDAIWRTIYRLFVSKRNLLRWNTAESVDASIINTRKGYFLTMWSSFATAVFLCLLLLLTKVSFVGVVIYSVVMVLWAIAFELAYQISQPKENKLKFLQEKNFREKIYDKELLMETARRTWQFFKDFSTKENHYLCPDNYQLAQVEKVSDKTSPTNIGLQFLSILSARDFGYETMSTTIQNVENLLDTVKKLEKWKGHLYNWYHVKSLDILQPAYISTVDSGNFLGHLITLKQGLLEQRKQPILKECQWSELTNTLNRSIQNCKRIEKNHKYQLKENYTTIGDLIEDMTEIFDDLSDRELSQHGSPCWCKELEKTIESLVEEAACFQLKNDSISSCPSLEKLALNNQKQAIKMIERINMLCNKIDQMTESIDFKFLFNEKRSLFHIGFHTSSHMLDAGCYDLMASESALISFLAIARGEAPLKHWHKLGRPLTLINGIPCFVSWSGTMFEYLMPNLVMREFKGSVYQETNKAAVTQQMIYAKEMELPFGISESQYYRFDVNSNYQYKAFGVPKLRLQPVFQNSMVITPYATMLALKTASQESFENLRRLRELGAFGEYGFYEAIDYNSPNSLDMTPYCIVKSFMAHHQGMILVSINNYLNQDIMQQRFHADPLVKATEVLLEEKRQNFLISTAKRGYTIGIGKVTMRESKYNNRYINSISPVIPVTNYLSNNKYSMLITSDGDGFSKYKNLMLYRWRADLYANTGNYIYVKDRDQGDYWSIAYHPTRKEPDEYLVVFSPHQAEFKRVDGDISTHTIISLSPDHDLEIRKVILKNQGNLKKTLEITSYLEMVADTHLAEMSHPAFNKLFMESDYIKEQEIFLTRRRSNKGGDHPYFMHMVRAQAKLLKQVEYENDRFKFIGRNHTLEDPDAVVNSVALSNHSGFCNDPIMSMRATVVLEAGETASVSFITGSCNSREEVMKIGEELKVVYRIDDIFEKFRLQSEIELKYLEITGQQVNAFQDVISALFYPSVFHRGPSENIRRNFKNQSSLWRFGISGDNPIMLLRVKSLEDVGVIKDTLKAYEYFRINCVQVDLVMLSDAKHGYLQELDHLINDMTTSLRIYDESSERPSLFLLHSYQMIPSEIDLLLTVARVVITKETGIYFRDVKESLNVIDD